MAWQTIFRLLPPPTPATPIDLPPIAYDQNNQTEDSDVFDLHEMRLFQELIGQPRQYSLLDATCLSRPGIIHQFALEYRANAEPYPVAVDYVSTR